jgi:WD40 repeat protein
LQLSPDGRYLLDVEREASGIVLWNLETGEKVQCLYCDRELPRSRPNQPPDTPNAALDPTSGQNDIPLRAVIAWGNELALWNMETGEQLQAFSITRGNVLYLDFSPDGQTILVLSRPEDSTSVPRLTPASASGQSLELIRVDVTTGAELNRIPLENASSVAVFTPDGTQAAVSVQMIISSEHEDEEHAEEELSDSANVVRLINLETGAMGPPFVGHDLLINSIDFSSDGQFMVTGSNDMTAIVWRVADGTIVKQFPELAVVRHAIFSPDGSLVLTIVEDNTAALWQVETPSIEEIVKWTWDNRKARELRPGECARYQIEELCS